MGTTGPERLEVVDFALGLLNAADERSPGFLLNCRDRATDQAFADATQYLGELVTSGEVEDLDIQFQIVPHFIQGDSDTVLKTLGFLADLDYIQQVSPKSQYYRFNRGTYADAKAFHTERHRPLTGSIDTYRRLADRFLAIINNESVEPLQLSQDVNGRGLDPLSE